jgi:hypothetical protein
MPSVEESQNLISVSGNQFKVHSEYPFDYAVYDLLGRVVQMGKRQSPGMEVKLRNLYSERVYVIKVIADNKRQLRKIIYM